VFIAVGAFDDNDQKLERLRSNLKLLEDERGFRIYPENTPRIHTTVTQTPLLFGKSPPPRCIDIVSQLDPFFEHIFYKVPTSRQKRSGGWKSGAKPALTLLWSSFFFSLSLSLVVVVVAPPSLTTMETSAAQRRKVRVRRLLTINKSLCLCTPRGVCF
jgi:hypothetical protein